MPESSPRHEELLSAYLDGELTEGERAEVEAWLAEDPHARSLLEELQGVSSAVKSLPAAELRTNLAPAVLSSIAERGNDPANGDAASTLPPAESWRGLSPRGLWWSAAAIAAALMLTFFSPPDDPPHQGPMDQGPVAKETARPRRGAAEMSSREQPSGEAEIMAATGELAVAADESSHFGGGENALPHSQAAIGPPAPLMADDAAPPADAQPLSVASVPPATVAGPREGQADPAYLVVWVDVPAESLQQRTIDRLLVRNNISVDDQIETWQAAAEPVRQHVATRLAPLNAEINAAPALSTQAVPDEGAARAGGGRGGAVPLGAANSLAQGGEAILVEATWEQVAQTLADMEADHQHFGAIQVETVALTATPAASPLETAREAAPPATAPPTEAPPPTASLYADEATGAGQAAPQRPASEPSPRVASPAPAEVEIEAQPQGRFSTRFDRRDEKPAPAVESALGRAQRLAIPPQARLNAPPTAAKPQARSADSSSEYGVQGESYSRSADGEAGAVNALESRQQQSRQSLPTAADSRQARSAPVQVLFVLRTRPSGAESAEAPPAAPAEPAAPTE